MKKVLIVDDSVYMRTLVREALSSGNYEIVGEAHDGQTAIEMALELNPDFITLDNVLPDMLGLEVLSILKKEQPQLKILMVSAVGQQTIKNKGSQLGASGYIVKPFSALQLIKAADEITQANQPSLSS